MSQMADFSKVIQSAQKVAQEESESGSSFKYRIVYPSEGTLKFRLLYNNKSGLVVRKILRHSIGDNKVPCFQMYGHRKEDCPICSALKDIESANKSVPSGSWAKPRMIAYAQYISSSYEIDSLKPGDVFILMGPKSLYESIQSSIAEISVNIKNMEDCFINYESNSMTVTRSSDNKYQFMINPYDKYKSASSQEEFDKLLDDVDDLNTTIVSAELTEEITKLVNASAEELKNKYLSGNVIPPEAPAQVPDLPKNVGDVANQAPAAPSSAPESKSNPTPSPAPSAPQNANKRKCYGDYNKIQTTDDPMSRALRALCPNCPDAAECKMISDSI